MKVKLLKKVHERFEIVHMPNGFVDSDGDIYDFNLFRLDDKNRDFIYSIHYAQLGKNTNRTIQFVNDIFIFDTKKDCIEYLKSQIIIRLRSEGHRGRKDRVIKNKVIKVWHI